MCAKHFCSKVGPTRLIFLKFYLPNESVVGLLGIKSLFYAHIYAHTNLYLQFNIGFLSVLSMSY